MKISTILAEILSEGFVNLFKKEDFGKYIDEIWDILQRSYRPIGGFLTASTKEELIQKTGMAKLVVKGGKVVAVKLYKDDRGRKSIAAGTGGTEEGKFWLKKMFQEDSKFDRSWGEFSGAAEHWSLQSGGVPVPNTLVGDILGKEIESLNPDGYHYTRVIGGEPHEKIMIGSLK